MIFLYSSEVAIGASAGMGDVKTEKSLLEMAAEWGLQGKAPAKEAS